ncbi:MAG: nuclear transport factor 2 family protein [Chitinophagales bacterium]
MTNKSLIEKFYSAFQAKDFKTMQACYDDKATFNDPVFTNLNAAQVRAMWEMFCIRGKDMIIQFRNIAATDTGGTATWIAQYTFSATGRKVVNVIQAEFEIHNGKIVTHTDRFSFYKWARQALGIKGFLLGSTHFLQSKVQKTAMHNLERFIESRNKKTE